MNKIIDNKVHSKALRQQLKNLRNQLPLAFQQCAARDLCNLIQHQDFYKHSLNIAFYYPFANEINLITLIKQALDDQKQCYLPVVNKEAKALSFVRYQTDTPLIENSYKIPEPSADKAEIIAPQDLDCVLMPLVGFDNSGNRLGTGAGFYDRSFAFKQQQPTAKPLLIGCAYECQLVSDGIQAQAWDVKMDGVVTEKRITFL